MPVSYCIDDTCHYRNSPASDSLSLFSYAVKVVQSTDFEVQNDGDIMDLSSGFWNAKSEAEKRRIDEMDKMILEILKPLEIS